MPATRIAQWRLCALLASEKKHKRGAGFEIGKTKNIRRYSNEKVAESEYALGLLLNDELNLWYPQEAVEVRLRTHVGETDHR